MGFPNPCTDFSRLVFRQHLATSVTRATLCSVSLTYISVESLHSKTLHEKELVSLSAMSGS